MNARGTKTDWYTGAIFGLLAVMAGLLVWMLLGGQIPRVVFAALIVTQGVLRAIRDRANEKMRNRSFVNLLISAVLGALIVTAT